MAIAKWALGLALAASVFLSGCAHAQAPSTPPPPAAADAPAPERPCYLIVMGTVTNREAFRAYAAALPPLYQRFGGVYLSVQRNPQALEGTPDFESIVISKWPSCAAANAFWQSPEYRQLVEMRKDWGRFTVVLADGLPAATTVAPMAQQPAPAPTR